jgi:hypothetical protein
MSSYFQLIRRLKDSHHYIQEITRQFALYRATQDQVDNQVYKAYNRATTNRLIVKEQAAAPLKQAAEFWVPTVPTEPGPPDDPTAPIPVGTTTLMLNFDHELEDRSNNHNDALFEFTNNQLLFAEGKDAQMNFAVNFNPNSNTTFDKLWIPFSNSLQIVYNTPSGFSIFTRIYPVTLSSLGTQQVVAPAPQTNRIRFWGSPVFNKYTPQIYVIWWGSAWNSGSTNSNMNTLRSHMATICNSQHFEGLWEYGGIKKPAAPIHLVDTSPLFSGSNMSNWDPTHNLFLSHMNDGSIPNPNSHGEPWSATEATPFDYKHMYCIMLPPGKFNPPGYYGATSRAFMPTTPFVHWTWSVLNPYDNSSAGGYTAMQNWEQAWAHEMLHQLTHPGMMGCATGGGYINDVCNSLQHAFGNGENCGAGRKTLSGTNIVTEPYWSDMAGKCIAPGSGESWVQQPAGSETGTIIRRYIFQKLDDLDNGATAAIGSDGTIYFNVKKAGLEYKRKTAAAAVAVNTWADLWFTFNNTTNTPSIYVNNVKYTTPSTEVLLWNNMHSHFILANYNLGAVTGQFRGRMDEFRLYRNMLTSDEQVDNFDANGLTITPVHVDSTQAVAIVNRCKIDSQLVPSPFVATDIDPGIIPPTGIISFTSTSFTPTSFTV